MYQYLNFVEVVSYEDVKVEASIVKAFKIRKRQTRFDTQKTWTTYYWYAPEMKQIVKWDKGDGDGSDVELKSYNTGKIGKTDKPENVKVIPIKPEKKTVQPPKCSKEEIKKLVDKGFSVQEALELCKEK